MLRFNKETIYGRFSLSNGKFIEAPIEVRTNK